MQFTHTFLSTASTRHTQCNKTRHILYKVTAVGNGQTTVPLISKPTGQRNMQRCTPSKRGQAVTHSLFNLCPLLSLLHSDCHLHWPSSHCFGPSPRNRQAQPAALSSTVASEQPPCLTSAMLPLGAVMMLPVAPPTAASLPQPPAGTASTIVNIANYQVHMKSNATSTSRHARAPICDPYTSSMYSTDSPRCNQPVRIGSPTFVAGTEGSSSSAGTAASAAAVDAAAAACAACC